MSTMALGGAKPAAKRTVRQSIRFHLMLSFHTALHQNLVPADRGLQIPF